MADFATEEPISRRTDIGPEAGFESAGSGLPTGKSEYGTHSLRRTKAAMIYRATVRIRAIPILLGHTKIENTVRYLGVDVEDALLLAERTEI